VFPSISIYSVSSIEICYQNTIVTFFNKKARRSLSPSAFSIALVYQVPIELLNRHHFVVRSV